MRFLSRSPSALLLVGFFLSVLLVGVQSSENVTSISDSFSETEQQQLSKSSESHVFQAEVSRLMDIIINSLYTQKEVFLRELISNAADALEKVRFLSVSDSTILESNPDLEIRIEVDKDAKTLTIQDSGVGMTKQELVNNLGTVARSGADVNLIGQFGVGFYSAFLVADKVTVISKSNAEPVQHVWESMADASFSVAPDPRGSTLGRGTRIILHLKDDSTEFLDLGKLRSVVTKFNQFVNVPIFLRTEREVEEEIVEDDEEVVESEDGQPKTKKVKKIIHEWEQLNKLKPIWLRSKESINETEYNDFYKSLSRDHIDPLASIHFSAEGEVDFTSILFVPGHEPYDAWSSYFSAKQDAIKLYARRVLVAEEVYELLPKWLNFIKGVVDSDDLPLKVDRESLSQTKMMKVISKKLVAKFLELARKLSKEDTAEWEKYRQDVKEGVETVTVPMTKYGKFWKFFGRNMKVGCVEDDSNRDKIAKTFRFHTSKTGLNETVTFDEYVARMPEDQKDILFIANDHFEAAMASPHAQIYKKKGWEVLIVSDPLDEPCLQRLSSYDSKSIVSIEKTNAKLNLTTDEKSRLKKLQKVFKVLTDFLTSHLKGKISRAQISQRLVEDPVAVMTDMYGHTPYSERVLRSQTFSARAVSDGSRFRVMEINPSHPLIKKLLEMVKTDSDDPQAESLADTLFETAMLSSGFSIDHPGQLVKKLVRLLQNDAGVPQDAVIQDYELSPEEDVEVAGEESGEESMEAGFDQDAFAELLKNMKETQGAQNSDAEGSQNSDPEGSQNSDAEGAQNSDPEGSQKSDQPVVSDHDEL